MPEVDRKLLEDLRNEMKTSPVTIPSMGEMMQNAAQGFNFAIYGKRTYGVADYRQPETVNGHVETTVLERFTKRRKQEKEDEALRTAMKLQQPEYVHGEDLKRELAFREKEESYNKKESDQEKDARTRNEQLDDVPKEELERKAAMLRDKLQQPIDDDDTYAQGQREYDRQYLAVVEDLMETQSSKGKLFGNYKKHIALAKEKYYFYTQESDRLIGKEQAKLLMSRDAYQNTLEQERQADPFPDLTLTIKDINLYAVRRVDLNQSPEVAAKKYETLKKAILEYREYASKVYELKKRLDALNTVEAQDIAARSQRLSALGAPDGEIGGGTRYGLAAFKKSIESELAIWKFHADACALCITRLSTPENIPIIDGTFCAQAPFIRQHFGIEPDGIKNDVKLWDQRISRRVGFESDESDFAEYDTGRAEMQGFVSRHVSRLSPDTTYFTDFADFSAQREMERAGARFRSQKIGQSNSSYGYGLRSNPLYRTTGLDRQKYYEWKAAGAKAQEFTHAVKAEIEAERKQHGDKKLSHQEELALEDECRDLTTLMCDLPFLGTVRDELAGTERTVMYFHGLRQADGSFQPVADEKPEEEDLSAVKDELKRCMKNLKTIRESDDADAVRQAIEQELPRVDTAFDDIDVFMTTGKSREIFTAKSHEEVFNNTAGLPTFERKARKLRDIISSMLQKDKSFRDAGGESVLGDNQEKLLHKWMFLNRVLSYVDYRMQVMEAGYDATPMEWFEDTTTVQSFWDKIYYDKMEGSDKIGEFLRNVPGKLRAALGGEEPQDEAGSTVAAAASAAAASAVAGDEEEEDEEEGEEKVDILTVPVEGEEEDWSEEDRKTWRRWSADMRAASEETDRRKRAWEAATEGFTRTEKQYLRLEYYESKVFTTRGQQREAIAKDLMKASDHAAYAAEHFALVERLSRVEGELEGKTADQKLLTEKRTLEEKITALRTKMDAILKDVDARTEELLGCVKEPYNKQEALSNDIAALKTAVDTKTATFAPVSADAVFLNELSLKLIRLQGAVGGPDLDMADAKQKCTDVIDHMKERFIEEAKAFITPQITVVRQYLNDPVNRDLLDVKKRDMKIFKILPLMDRFETALGKSDTELSYYVLMVGAITKIVNKDLALLNQVTPPYINRLMADALALQTGLEDIEGKPESQTAKKTIAFSDKVQVARFDKRSGVMHEAPEEISEDEEEATQKIRKEQRPLKRASSNAADGMVMDLLNRIPRARRVIKTEHDKSMKEFTGFAEDILARLKNEDVDEDTMELLNPIASLIVPLDQESADPQALRRVYDDDAMKAGCEDMIGHVRTMLREDASAPEVTAAVTAMLPVITAAFEDLKNYAGSEEGSRILSARIPGDYSGLDPKTARKDNYTEDLEGFATLKIKADCLFGVVKLLLGTDGVLSDQDEKLLRQMRDTLMRLTDHLEWRENIFSEVEKQTGDPRNPTDYSSPDPKTGILNMDMANGTRTIDFINDIREEPENWSLPAFKWEQRQDS